MDWDILGVDERVGILRGDGDPKQNALEMKKVIKGNELASWGGRNLIDV